MKVDPHRVTWPSQRAWLEDIMRALRGAGLSQGAAMVAAAHAAYSSGTLNHDQPATWNYILWGIKAWSERVPFVELLGSEEKAGQAQPKRTMRWLSSSTIDEAVSRYLGVLEHTRRPDGTLRYTAALALLRAGDTRYFREVLVSGWGTVGVDRGVTGMMSNYARVAKLLGASVSSSTGSSVVELLLVGTAVAIAALLFVR